jgi:hypothetical protein
MNLKCDTPKSVGNTVAYGRKLFDAAILGMRTGLEVALNGQRLSELLVDLAGDSAKLALAGAFVGLWRSSGTHRHSRLRDPIAYAALWFCAGVAWKTRKVTANMAHSALKELIRVRDEHWLEANPIDYA